MTLKAAIIADDLTGALDTGTPFVDAGLSVAVAIDVETADEALAAGTDVVVINTASRALSEDDAARRVRQAADALSARQPAIVLKKIDSRLKGNVAAESAALADALGLARIVVAPAIPDQDRTTYRGFVVGRGVEKPIAVADLFTGRDMDVVVADAESDFDLDDIALGNDWNSVLAVGARGLGSALARKIGRAGGHPLPFQASPDALCLRVTGPDHGGPDEPPRSRRCAARRHRCADGQRRMWRGAGVAAASALHRRNRR